MEEAANAKISRIVPFFMTRSLNELTTLDYMRSVGVVNYLSFCKDKAVLLRLLGLNLFMKGYIMHFLPENFWAGIVGSLVFGLLGMVLLLLGYWLFDLITPRIDVQKELKEKNLAVAVVIGALLLGIAYITAHVVQ